MALSFDLRQQSVCHKPFHNTFLKSVNSCIFFSAALRIVEFAWKAQIFKKT